MKTKVEECKQISIYPLIRRLLQVEYGIDSLSTTDGFSVCTVLTSENRTKYIQLSYYLGEDARNLKEVKYKIKLTRTKCHIDGYRYWGICPLRKDDGTPCGKRVGVLYKPPNESYFGCRHCHDLTYKSRCYSGHEKKFRPIISFPSLNKEEGNIKRKYYRGKYTKRYKRFLKKSSDNLVRLGAITKDFEKRVRGDSV